jgi:hypothetical protein
MAGQQTLDLFVEVRILCPQLKNPQKWVFPFYDEVRAITVKGPFSPEEVSS